jgi:hypothetical protein
LSFLLVFADGDNEKSRFDFDCVPLKSAPARGRSGPGEFSIRRYEAGAQHSNISIDEDMKYLVTFIGPFEKISFMSVGTVPLIERGFTINQQAEVPNNLCQGNSV